MFFQRKKPRQIAQGSEITIFDPLQNPQKTPFLPGLEGVCDGRKSPFVHFAGQFRSTAEGLLHQADDHARRQQSDTRDSHVAVQPTLSPAPNKGKGRPSRPTDDIRFGRFRPDQGKSQPD
jgi:hypothetical protein